jgi:hypothetical protein
VSDSASESFTCVEYAVLAELAESYIKADSRSWFFPFATLFLCSSPSHRIATTRPRRSQAPSLSLRCKDCSSPRLRIVPRGLPLRMGMSIDAFVETKDQRSRKDLPFVGAMPAMLLSYLPYIRFGNPGGSEAQDDRWTETPKQTLSLFHSRMFSVMLTFFLTRQPARLPPMDSKLAWTRRSDSGIEW